MDFKQLAVLVLAAPVNIAQALQPGKMYHFHGEDSGYGNYFITSTAALRMTGPTTCGSST